MFTSLRLARRPLLSLVLALASPLSATNNRNTSSTTSTRAPLPAPQRDQHQQQQQQQQRQQVSQPLGTGGVWAQVLGSVVGDGHGTRPCACAFAGGLVEGGEQISSSSCDHTSNSTLQTSHPSPNRLPLDAPERLRRWHPCPISYGYSIFYVQITNLCTLYHDLSWRLTGFLRVWCAALNSWKVFHAKRSFVKICLSRYTMAAYNQFNQIVTWTPVAFVVEFWSLIMFDPHSVKPDLHPFLSVVLCCVKWLSTLMAYHF